MSLKPGWQGRFFEDFEVGDVYRSSVGRTITEADNTWFSLLTNNQNPIHIDAEYAKRTEFGRPLVNSTFTLAVITGLTVSDISQNAVNLGWDVVKLPSPLFAGDTLYAETEVLEKRESRSRPHMGVVRFRTRGIQQEGKVVIEFERTVLAWKRAYAPATGGFPEVERS